MVLLHFTAHTYAIIVNTIFYCRVIKFTLVFLFILQYSDIFDWLFCGLWSFCVLQNVSFEREQQSTRQTIENMSHKMQQKLMYCNENNIFFKGQVKGIK